MNSQNAPQTNQTRIIHSPLKNLSNRQLFGILLLLTLLCDNLFHVRLLFMRRLDLPGILLKVQRIQLFEWLGYQLPVIQVTINRISLDEFFLCKVFDLKFYTGFGPYLLARVPVFLVVPLILWYVAKFMKQHPVIRDLFFLFLALLGMFGFKLQQTANASEVAFELFAGIVFLIGAAAFWAFYDRTHNSYRNLVAHFYSRFGIESSVEPKPSPPNAGETDKSKQPFHLASYVLKAALRQEFALIVATTLFFSYIDSVGWVGLVLGFFALKWMYNLIVDGVVQILRLNMGPSFEENLGSWFSITSLAVCTVGLLQRTFGIRMTVGIATVFIAELFAGFLHFGLKTWNNSKKLDHINTDEFWICFLTAIAALFLIAFGDYPVLHVYGIYEYTSWGRTSEGFAVCMALFCISFVLLLWQFKSDLPAPMHILFTVCFVCVVWQAQTPTTCSPSTSPQEVAALSELFQGKTHACVTGTFEIPNSTQWTSTLIKPGAKYPAWFKFVSSKDESSPDIKSSMNGLMIKLHGLDPAVFHSHTHDFMLFSHSAFFTSDPAILLEYTKLDNSIPAFFKWVFPSVLDPRSWRIGPALMLASYHLPILMWPFTNPLQMNYYSTTPYIFTNTNGTSQAVKYIVTPCQLDTSEEAKKDKDHRRLAPNTFFRDNLRRSISTDDKQVCLNFYVQKQEDDCTTAGTSALDDSTRPWLSQKILVGKLYIPPQDLLREQSEFCETLNFHPWNTVQDHKPYSSQKYQSKDVVVQPPKKFNKELGTINMGNIAEYQYQSYIYPTMPKYVKTLLPQFTFNVKHVRELYTAFTTFSAVPDHTHLQTLDQYWELLLPQHHRKEAHKYIPQLSNYFLKDWKDDFLFGIQFLIGVSPMAIIRHTPETPLPADFDLDSDKNTIKKIDTHLLGPQGLSWSFLKNNNRLVFTDYKILDDIQKINDQVVVYSSIIVLYLNDQGYLMPLAIQLERTPGLDYIYTPLDPPNAWLFARMHAIQSDGLIHETVDHLCFTHLVIESTIIAVNRQLPASHPVYKLLVPHFLETIAINDLGRDTLLHPTNSSFDTVLAIGMKGAVQLMNKAYVTQFNISERSLPKELAARGFGRDGTDNLPGYLYRTDAYEIWDTLFEYVDSVIRRHYTSDDQVAKDLDLQGLRTEMADPELANVRGMPEIKTRESLVDILTTIVWLATAQHSAVNIGQADFYGYIPNRPLRLHKPMPENLNLVDEAYIVSALPDIAEATKAIETAKVLSTNPDPLLMVLDGVVAPENREFYVRLQNRLKRFGEEVVMKRPVTSPLPRYRFFHPDQVAGSISV